MPVLDTPNPRSGKPIPSDAWIVSQVAAPKARLLCISDNPDDHRGLHHFIDHSVWQLTTAHTCRSGFRRLAKGVEVVFCECSLPDGNWKDVLSRITTMERPPQLVVISRLADAYLWSEVLNLGGFDVLAKPLSEREVRLVLEATSRFRLRPERRVHGVGVM